MAWVAAATFVSGGCPNGETPVCHTTIEDLTNLELTPIANDGFEFRLWEPDTARGFPCDVRRQDADGTIAVTVVHDGACYAVVAPIDPNPPAAPGVVDAPGGRAHQPAAWPSLR